MTARLVVATDEESELLFDLWRLAYEVRKSKWLPDPLTALDAHVQKMLDAGFIVPEIVDELR